jgi:hypothetical protein
MSNSIGGPRMMSFRDDPLSEWDRDTWERIQGVVGDRRPTWSELVAGPTQPPAGFLHWEFA